MKKNKIPQPITLDYAVKKLREVANSDLFEKDIVKWFDEFDKWKKIVKELIEIEREARNWFLMRRIKEGF